MPQRPTRPARRPLPLLAAALCLAGGPLAACGPRAVQVTTGEAPAAESSIDFTNNLAQAVNVYARVSSGSEIFLRQVAGRTTESIAVRGVAAGTSVTLRAAPVDGSANYSRENVVLGRGVAWRVP
jgi:hypothetical protein